MLASAICTCTKIKIRSMLEKMTARGRVIRSVEFGLSIEDWTMLVWCEHRGGRGQGQGRNMSLLRLLSFFMIDVRRVAA